MARRSDGSVDPAGGPDAALGPGRGFVGDKQAGIALYEPPLEGWPWLALVALPWRSPELERGRYVWEHFDTQPDAAARMAWVAQELAGADAVVRMA